MEGNLLTNTAQLAIYVTLSYVKEGDLVIDATCGNGHDSLALAESVGKGGTVLAVDLQQQAIDRARKLLRASGIENTVFVCGSFVHLSQYVEDLGIDKKPSAVVFNLGYLPGGDKKVTTRTEDTIAAAETALELIKTGGVVTLVMYPGHGEGKKEKDALLAWAKELPAAVYHTVYASLPNQQKNPPQALWITKKK